MTVYDCFTIDAELDMLELRLHELRDVVDIFVAVQAHETFTGSPKPLGLTQALIETRFASFRRRLFAFDTPLPPGGAWEREAFQRNRISDVLRLLRPADSDLVLVSDVDEIPRAIDVSHAWDITRTTPHATVAFQQAVYFYDPTCLNILTWYGTRAVRYRDLGAPQRLRATEYLLPHDVVLPDAGWHFSSFMDADAIRRKVAAYSHTEVNQPQFTSDANITEALDICRSLVPGDGQTFARITPRDLPAYMWSQPAKYGLAREVAA